MPDSGLAALDRMIARLRALAGPKVGARVAERAAPGVESALRATAAAGTTPEGATWQPKKGGGRPLAGAAGAISAQARGNFIVATLRGPTVFHHRGAKGMPVRQVLPDSGTIPPGVARALLEAARAVVRELAAGRG